jgi:RNA polymerase sigma-70 factor (ECF subfamily)
VEQALRRVPEPFRVALILRDIEGFSYEEVAAMQGVNLGTVKSRLVRGRTFLKAVLEASRLGSRTKALSGMELSLREEAR